MPEYPVEQCACGFVARVPVGESVPYGWKRLLSGRTVCPKCQEKAT